ncbi:MAG: universal stress protein [Proteobacteria bacterium]|nr:universal stress protein [Pseudomonadota bacterium]MBU1058784.1 universal stress protein [Pseudomonadota bacterium]
MVTISKILVPLDFTDCSVSVLPYAKFMTEKFSAELFLLYTLAGPEQFKGMAFEEDWFHTYGRVLKTQAERAMENFVELHLDNCRPTGTIIRIGETVEEIVACADEKNIDLIIMASHNCQTAERRIYGSIATAVSRDASCPVMILHPDNLKEKP